MIDDLLIISIKWQCSKIQKKFTKNSNFDKSYMYDHHDSQVKKKKKKKKKTTVLMIFK